MTLNISQTATDMATVTRPLSGAAATFPAGANQIRLAAGAPTKIRLAAAGDFFRRRRNSARPRERRHITLLVSLVWNTWYQTFCNLLFTDVLSVIESANPVFDLSKKQWGGRGAVGAESERRRREERGAVGAESEAP